MRINLYVVASKLMRFTVIWVKNEPRMKAR
jgi:hypothetical protein